MYSARSSRQTSSLWVSVVAVPANLSATVPLNVTFAVKRNGDFVCPEGYAITNTGSEIFHVSDIRVTMLDATYSFVESDENLQERQIYLTMTGTNPGMMSPISDTVTFVSGSDNTKQSFGTEPTTYNTWNVNQGGKIEFEFKGKVNGISAKWANKQELFTIAYTIEPGEIYGPNPKV